MAGVLTAAQMRSAEQAAIESGAVTGLELMERAGRGVVNAVFEAWPELAEAGAAAQTDREQSGPKKRAMVLCGPGNNGGDGFVVARLLHGLGWAVEVFLWGEADSLPPDAKANCLRWQAIGPVAPLDRAEAGAADLVVDALFGTGLTRPLHWDVQNVLARSKAVPRRVAVDVPSGLSSDTGADLGGTLPCDLTVTFHTAKPGHYLADGPSICGQVAVVDIGLPMSLEDTEMIGAPVGMTKRAGHKFAHGHALVLSGGLGRTGAARLAARGALRIGAGLVTLGVPDDAVPEVAAQITAIMMRPVDGAAALERVLDDRRINALCLGPGLGQDRARALMPVAVGNQARPAVLDADALTAFAGAPESLFDMLHEACVLTPHGGEFAALFPDINERLAKGGGYSKLDATQAAARRAGCVVLFKGPDTVIAAQDGRCAIHAAAYDRAAPWLATAGSGDALAGFITGLLARGMAPMQAAVAAAWLHAECARRFGPGLIAEDLPEQLPLVLRQLEA